MKRREFITALARGDRVAADDARAAKHCANSWFSRHSHSYGLWTICYGLFTAIERTRMD